MWAAWVVEPIALAATAFMVRFLIALLRESAPSVCYWLVPVRGEPEKGLRILRGIRFEDDCRATESYYGDYRLELMENEHHAEKKCTSDLMALAVRPVRHNLVWRAIEPNRGDLFRGRRV